MHVYKLRFIQGCVSTLIVNILIKNNNYFWSIQQQQSLMGDVVVVECRNRSYSIDLELKESKLLFVHLY